MRKNFKYALLMAAALAMPVFTACDDDDDEKSESQNTDYTNKTYGQDAIDACAEVSDLLVKANTAIAGTRLTDDQEKELKAILATVVDDVIVPTYTALADATEELEKALGNLTANEVQQSNIDAACEAFKKARAEWEKSEAFLGGAASDFDIDPSIDSWPLNRDLLLTYFKDGEYSEEAIEDASILGFHAVEFILFRDGQPRKVSELKGNDTYKGFGSVKGSEELKYVEDVIAELKLRAFQLQIAWAPNSNASRKAVVDAAFAKDAENYGYQTKNGTSYGDNLKAADATSTFGNLLTAIQQVLSLDEGSCLGIADEVGTGKIANPFSAGHIFYVESPYSYNSITDFQNNMRSIENVWYGNRNGAKGSAAHSFHKFFADNQTQLGKQVDNAIAASIEKIGLMPYPFVKYVSTIWNKSFEDDPVVDLEEE